VTKKIICWSIETPPTSFSNHIGPYILKQDLLKSGLSLLLSRALIFHRLRPIHPLILLEALSLIEIVGY